MINMKDKIIITERVMKNSQRETVGMELNRLRILVWDRSVWEEVKDVPGLMKDADVNLIIGGTNEKLGSYEVLCILNNKRMIFDLLPPTLGAKGSNYLIA